MGNKWEVPVRAKINRSLELLTEKGHNLEDMQPILVRYDMVGHTAGRAFWKHNMIKLNGGILNRYTDYFIEHTVPHEVAHLVACFLNGNRPMKKPHGYEWRSLMVELGLSPDRTHRYETLSSKGGEGQRRETPYRYKCNCREFMLSATRHRRHMQSSANRYRCVKCHTQLQYVGL